MGHIFRIEVTDVTNSQAGSQAARSRLCHSRSCPHSMRACTCSVPSLLASLVHAAAQGWLVMCSRREAYATRGWYAQVTVRWVFPESSPGDASAWVGVWDTSEFDWTAGQPRPRYIRYKSLTSTRQEGTVRFGPKEWSGLADGEYVCSIDTGSIAVGAAGSRSYCVSQVCRAVAVVACHEHTGYGTCDASVPRHAERVGACICLNGMLAWVVDRGRSASRWRVAKSSAPLAARTAHRCCRPTTIAQQSVGSDRRSRATIKVVRPAARMVMGRTRTARRAPVRATHPTWPIWCGVGPPAPAHPHQRTHTHTSGRTPTPADGASRAK